MGWDRFESSLRDLFAEAWSRDLMESAVDLAWIVATLRHPDLRVTPGLRALLDVIEATPGHPPASGSLPPQVLRAVATELRHVVSRHSHTGEQVGAYVTQV